MEKSKSHIWQLDDLEYLRQNYENKDIPFEEIKSFLGRSKNSITAKALSLGLKRNRLKLGSADIDWLKSNYANTQNEEIRKKLDISELTLRAYIKRFGLAKKNGFEREMYDKGVKINVPFSQSEIAYLRENYPNPNISVREMAKHLNRTLSSIKGKAINLNIERITKKGKYNKSEFTDLDIAYLRDNFGNTEISISDIAEKLGRKNSCIYRKARSLGLKRIEIRRYTDLEVKYLIDNYSNKNLSVSEIAERLNRSDREIHQKACLLGLKRRLMKKIERTRP